MNLNHLLVGKMKIMKHTQKELFSVQINELGLQMYPVVMGVNKHDEYVDLNIHDRQIYVYGLKKASQLLHTDDEVIEIIKLVRKGINPYYKDIVRAAFIKNKFDADAELEIAINILLVFKRK